MLFVLKRGLGERGFNFNEHIKVKAAGIEIYFYSTNYMFVITSRICDSAHGVTTDINHSLCK